MCKYMAWRSKNTNEDNTDNVVLRMIDPIRDDESEGSEYSESQSIDIGTTNNHNIGEEQSVAQRVIQLKNDYNTGNERFKKGSIGTVINAKLRKDKKLKVKLDNTIKKNSD